MTGFTAAWPKEYSDLILTVPSGSVLGLRASQAIVPKLGPVVTSHVQMALRSGARGSGMHFADVQSA
ncbi:hypothetical protein D1F64_16700 [Breoghania sp. L-A4]|nr:hypothetical protein D1F64_16700 [Breoghania sp. L-A4]